MAYKNNSKTTKMALFFIIILFSNYIFGCKKIEYDTIFNFTHLEDKNIKITHLTLKDGSGIIFDKNGGQLSKNSINNNTYWGISGINRNGEKINVKFNDIHSINVERKIPDGFMTTSFTLISLTALGLLALIMCHHCDLTGGSCPYVYTFDGKHYIFNSECFPGSISKNLQNTDYAKLNSFHSSKGLYELLIRNDDYNEIQFTDYISVLQTDYSPDYLMVCNETGEISAIKNLTPPLLATGNGNNVISFFEKCDEICWESASDFYKDSNSLRDQIILHFPKPEKTNNVKLYFKGGSAYWGNEMMNRFVGLRPGTQADWHKELESNDTKIKGFKQLFEEEELFDLNINYYNGEKWNTKGIIHSGGGIANFERIIDLDISDVQGNIIKITINPPKGYWKIDYIGISADYINKIEYKELLAIKATDNKNNNISSLINNIDGKYHVMKTNGEYFKLSFPATPINVDKKRTLFIKTSGYYTNVNNQTANIDILRYFSARDGNIIRYSLKEYSKLLNKYSNIIK